jgi:hypothetical protein
MTEGSLSESPVCVKDAYRWIAGSDFCDTACRCLNAVGNDKGGVLVELITFWMVGKNGHWLETGFWEIDPPYSPSVY